MHCDAMDKTKSFMGFTIIQRQSRTGILNGKELKKKSTIKENEKSYNLLTMLVDIKLKRVERAYISVQSRFDFLWQVQVILFVIDCAIFYTNLHELFCQFIS